MAKTGHGPKQLVFLTVLPNYLAEMCVIHLKFLADFSVFPKAMRYPVRHVLNAKLDPDSCSQMVFPITHFWGYTLLCLQIRCPISLWGELKQRRHLLCLSNGCVQYAVWCRNPQLRSSICMINPKNWGSSESIFVEGQCFLRRRSGPTAFPFDMGLKGQCHPGGWVHNCCYSTETRVKWHQLKGVNTFVLPFGPSPRLLALTLCGSLWGGHIFLGFFHWHIQSLSSECWDEWIVTLFLFLLHSLNTKWLQILLLNRTLWSFQTNVAGWKIALFE